MHRLHRLLSTSNSRDVDVAQRGTVLDTAVAADFKARIADATGQSRQLDLSCGLQGYRTIVAAIGQSEVRSISTRIFHDDVTTIFGDQAEAVCTERLCPHPGLTGYRVEGVDYGCLGLGNRRTVRGRNVNLNAVYGNVTGFAIAVADGSALHHVLVGNRRDARLVADR